MYTLHQIAEDRSVNLSEASNSFIFTNETHSAQKGCQMIIYTLQLFLGCLREQSLMPK